jgi:hypothetical protein
MIGQFSDMGNGHEEKRKFVPNKDILIHTLQFLPLKNSLRLGVLSKYFNDIIDSEEMYKELLTTHKIFIVTNNRTYNSSKEKLFKNVLFDPNERRTFPNLDVLKAHSKSKPNKHRHRNETINNFYWCSNLKDDGNNTFFFPKGDTKYMKDFHSVLLEEQVHFEQFVKYNVDPKSKFCMKIIDEIKSKIKNRLSAPSF